MNQTNKPVAYTLIIDKDAARNLKLLMNLSREYLESHEDIVRSFPKEDLTSLVSFVEQVSDKNHETFGCGDPACLWKPKNKPVSHGEI